MAHVIPAQVVCTFVCPVCKGGLRLNQDFTRLRCVQCGRRYRVQDEIPVLLPQEAEVP